MNFKINSIAIAYSNKERYFDCINGKFIPKNWCKKVNLIPFLYPDIFVKYLETDKRYSLWIGGNGSAKSTSKAKYFLQKALQKDHFFRLLFLRHNHSDIRMTTFQMFKGLIEKEGLSQYFRCSETTMTIVCVPTGNILYSAGLDSTGKLSGIDDVTDIWFEEPITRSNGKIEMITPEQFEDLDSRLRMPNAKLTMHLTLNPISKDFFIYKNLLNPELKKYERLYNLDDWNVCNSTYLDNPFLPDSAIKVIEGFKGERAEYGKKGQWVEEKTGNEWLSEFKKDIHTKVVPFIIGIDIQLTFDFNMLPYQTALAIQLIRRKNGILQIRVFKEYCLTPPLNSPENACKFLIDDFIKPYEYINVTVFGDASGKYGYNNYHGIFTELLRYTHEESDQVMKRNPIIRNARDLINEILAGKHNLELVVDDACINLIRDLETLQTAPDGFDNEKKNGIETKGHCYSALVYFICKQFDTLLKENQRNY